LPSAAAGNVAGVAPRRRPRLTPVQSRSISDLRLRSDQPEVNQPKKTVSAATFA